MISEDKPFTAPHCGHIGDAGGCCPCCDHTGSWVGTSGKRIHEVLDEMRTSEAQSLAYYKKRAEAGRQLENSLHRLKGASLDAFQNVTCHTADDVNDAIAAYEEACKD